MVFTPFCSILNDVGVGITFLHCIWSCTRGENSFLCPGTCRKAFHGYRDAIQSHWPEPLAEGWLNKEQLDTQRQAGLGLCWAQLGLVMSELSNITCADVSICLAFKGTCKVFLYQQEEFFHSNKKRFLIHQRKTGRWDVCRPIYNQKRHYFQEPFFIMKSHLLCRQI